MLPELTLTELERMAIEQALQKTGGNCTQVAAILGIARSTVHRKIRRYGIRIALASTDPAESVDNEK